MAAGDGELMRTPQSGTPPDRRSPRRISRSSLPASGMKCPVGRHKALFPDEKAHQADAWHLDDWGRTAIFDERISQMSERIVEHGVGITQMMDRISVLEGSPTLENVQHMIADVVRAEFQVDLDSAVLTIQAEGDLCKAAHKDAEGSFARQDAELQKSLATLSQQVEELRNAFQEHRIGKLQRDWAHDIGPVANERSAIDPGCLHSEASFHSMGERATADHSRFGADETRRHLQVMSEQSSQLAMKIARHDADIHTNAIALNDVEKKLLDVCEKERLNAQAVQVRQAEGLKQFGALEREVEAHAAKLQVHDPTLQCLQIRLSKAESEQHALRSDMDSRLQKTEVLNLANSQVHEPTLQGLQIRLSKAESEQQALHSDMDSQLIKTEVLSKQAQEFTIGLRDLIHGLQTKLESKVDLEEREERRDRQLREILQASEDGLRKREEELTRVANALELRDTRVEVLSSEIRRTQADMAEEAHRSRDLLRQWVDEASGEDTTRVADLVGRMASLQTSITSQGQVLSQHSIWFQKSNVMPV